ncbi:hypothetical protein FHL15_007462 [Xylaria flabelliformis]|uniref:Heterokaryon incompatibility domain-containing protein n=1 Tax=Xylaria flabelliformis TaxID=2512241 RepID=A0A553HUQ3_9PEZI|nr:hypothetical protein FHL15_007462 [Xylaria flabelliformis]
MSTVRLLQDHEKGIPWTTLPKTFQEAVTICRIMEVKYLWIDALCILQQSSDLREAETEITKADFAGENSIMASIYQGSHFTICADISTNMDSGIISIDGLRKCLPLMVRGDDERNATVYVRADRKYHSRHQLDIDTRGWTFQEFLLSCILENSILHGSAEKFTLVNAETSLAEMTGHIPDVKDWATQDSCRAGIWERSLPHDLCWYNY